MESTATQRINDQQIAELEQKYERVKHVTYNGVDLVFRQPKPVEMDQHAAKGEAATAAEKASADKILAQQLIVQCGDVTGDSTKVREAFNALLKKYPYLYRNKKVGMAIAVLTGVVEEEEGNG